MSIRQQAALAVIAGWIAGCAARSEAPATPPERPLKDLGQPATAPLWSDVRFKLVSDGTCRPMRVLAHADEIYVHFGKHGTFARIKPGGDLEDFSVRDERFGPAFASRISAVEGTWGGALWVRALDQDGAHERLYRRSETGWARVDDELGAETRQISGWRDGGALVSLTCAPGGRCEDGPRFIAVGGATEAPRFPELKPARAAEGCRTDYTFTSLASGEIFASGRFCHALASTPTEPWYAVRWSPAGGPRVDVVAEDPARQWRPGPVIATGPERVCATAVLEAPGAGTPRTLVAVLADDTWTLLPTVEGDIVKIDVDADGAPWLLLGVGQRHRRLVRHTPAGWRPVTTTTDWIEDFGDLRGAHTWLLDGKDDLWLRQTDGLFARVSLPSFPAVTRSIRVRSVAATDAGVWLAAHYHNTMAEPSDASIRKMTEPCLVLMRSGDGPTLGGP